MGITHLSPSSSSSMPLIRGNSFYVGQAVEVTNNPPCSYFEATVISRLPTGSYVVEYSDLLNEIDGDSEDNINFSFFIEKIDPKDLRPQPPPVVVPAAEFSLNQKVDAYESEAWWATTITRRIDSNHYYVRCLTRDSDFMVHSSQIRVHQDWIDGRWVLP